MPPAIYTQSIIALIWDFDKTLTHGYMQEPLFNEYGVDAGDFWREVNALAAYYEGLKPPGGPARVGKDTIYLNHILTYVRSDIFEGLTNAKLRELGSQIQLAPGIPGFFEEIRRIEQEDRYVKHDIKVENYVVSTGLRAMIEGSAVGGAVEGIWACDLLPEAAPQGFEGQLPTGSPTVAQVGYTIDNTSKTRAIFEINKGVNKNPAIDVNSLIPEDQRRVPIQNMIYIADGPSDVPSFSLVNGKGGRTLGVYAPGDRNYESAASLEEQGRVQSIAQADYSDGMPAVKWLTRAVRQMADRIVENRETSLSAYGGAPATMFSSKDARGLKVRVVTGRTCANRSFGPVCCARTWAVS